MSVFFVQFSTQHIHQRVIRTEPVDPKFQVKIYWHSINVEWSWTAAVARYICGNCASGYLKLLRDRHKYKRRVKHNTPGGGNKFVKSILFVFSDWVWWRHTSQSHFCHRRTSLLMCSVHWRQHLYSKFNGRASLMFIGLVWK